MGRALARVPLQGLCGGLLLPATLAAQSLPVFDDTFLPQGGLDCLIEPAAVIEVSTREDGVLESVEVGRGDRISAGDVVARLESGVESIQVELARARAAMSGNIEQKRATVGFMERQRQRIDDLYAKKAVPFGEKDKAETDLLLAQMDLRDARETAALAAIELRRAEQALERRTVRSPVDGVVVQRLLLPGESVDDRPIMTVAQVDPLHVEVIVPVSRWGSFTVGDRASVLPLVPGGEAREAVVAAIDRVVDAASNTFGVQLELANPDYAVPGGIRCEVSFAAD